MEVNQAMEQMLNVNFPEGQGDNARILELLQQYNNDPTLLTDSIKQLIQEGSNSSGNLDTSFSMLGLTGRRQVEAVDGGLSAQQLFLRGGGLYTQDTVQGNVQEQVIPLFNRLDSGDLLNFPAQQTMGVHDTLMRCLKRQEQFPIPQISQPSSSPLLSPPPSTRCVTKQYSMPERHSSFNIPELDTPFTSLSQNPFHPDILSAHTTPGRRRTNSEPVLSQDIPDLFKPENLKHILQKLPPAYNAVSVIAPFLSQMDVKSCCQLLKGLGKCNSHSRAWQIFQLIREIPAGSLGAHLKATEVYAQMIQLCQNSVYNALQIYKALIEDSLIPNSGIYSSLLSILAKCEDYERTQDLYHKAYHDNLVDKDIAGVMVDMYSRTEQWDKVTDIFQDLKRTGVEPDIQLYNSVINLASKKRQFQVSLSVYERIFHDELLPSHKTLLVIRSTIQGLFSGKQHVGNVVAENGIPSASVELIGAYMELITNYSPEKYRSTLYQILMTSFDKQGEVGHAMALYDCLKQSEGYSKLSIDFCNIAISACAHQGYCAKAQNIFDDMQMNCEVGPQAVTYANLVRAYKKGGKPCSAILVFEKMKEAGYSPHGAVYGSCIDLCWKTGLPWAQAKGMQLLLEGFERNLLDSPTELVQRNTLKLDLCALTCGAAVFTMCHWLVSLRERLMNSQDPSLLGVKRLVVVNGVGEGTKGQTSCTVVKNVVASSLVGHRSPFTLTQDSRLLKLEAQMAALKQWVLSDSFTSYYLSLGTPNSQLMQTAQYVEMENKILLECGQLWSHLCRQQAMSRPNLQAMHPEYIQLRLNLIVQLQDIHQRCNMSELSLFSSILLMDILMSNQVVVSSWELVRLPMLCAHIVRSADEVNANSALFAGLAQCNSEQFNAFVQKFERFVPQPVQFLVTPIHFLRLFVERLGHSIEDSKVQQQMAACNLLVLDVISNPASVQFPASVLAPAALKLFRKSSGSSPEWPSVLTQLTTYNDDHPNLVECEKLVMISRGRISSVRGGLVSTSA